MKTRIAVVLAVALAYFAGQFRAGAFLGALAMGGGAGDPETTANGDVNCDGEIDLSDAVYTLNWLFLGGRDPCPSGDETAPLLARIAELETELETTRTQLAECIESCECPPCPPCPPSMPSLPGTGIEACWDGAGRIVACESRTCPGQDGLYQAGCSEDGRFVDNGSTVIDTCTGLEWEKTPPSTTYDWCSAVARCDGLVLDGADDWRLPNAKELQSIVNYGRVLPALYPVFGTSSALRVHWSSTSGVNVPSRAWAVDFGDGLVGGDAKSARYRVRAVRGGIVDQ